MTAGTRGSSLAGPPLAGPAERPLAGVSKGLAAVDRPKVLRPRRPAGRPRRVLALESGGQAIQGAPPIPALDTVENGHFASTLLPRGLPIAAAVAYSGIPARRLWAYLAEGRLRPIRLPGMRRVLLDRLDLDALLEAGKGAPDAGREAHG